MTQEVPPQHLASLQQSGEQQRQLRPTAAGGAPDSPTARAATPVPMQDQPVHPTEPSGNGSLGVRQRSLVSVTADGSAHGGRHFFGQQALREAAWREAEAEEWALEQHSLEGRPHPAQLVGGSGRGRTAGLAALQLELQAPGHHPVWVGEDGGVHYAWRPSSRPSSRGGSRHGPGNGGYKEGSVKGGREGSVKGGGSGGPFANAVVSIEEPREADVWDWGAYFGSLPKKLKGGLDTRLPVPPLREIFWAWLGAFLGILAVSALNQWVTPEIDIAFIVGSFGASAVLIFALLESKMSQPRNFLGGQFLSALVGITVRVIIHKTWIAAPVGMSLALIAMQLTATTHPPGGATALIACTLPELPKWHGYSYLVTIAVGSLAMQLIALVVNNLDPRRRYPTFWW